MSLIKFPGLIDIHVHLRDPGATQKEDFTTGSAAAVAGGFTFILDMPNNPIPTITIGSVEDKVKRSKDKGICDIGFHYGTDGKNLDTFRDAAMHQLVYGLKIYCNHTTGDLLVEDKETLENIFNHWNSSKPIPVHAEETLAEYTIFLADKYKRRLHICHIARSSEVSMVRKAKKKHIAVSTGVTPHHLFITQKTMWQLGPLGSMKPTIGFNRDREALWTGLRDGTIDIIESDHAPHTKKEKISDKPPYGVPGLETTLGLMLKARKEKRVTIEQIKMWLHDNPKKLFSIPDQPHTSIEFDPDEPYRVREEDLYTKCHWSPFTGWELFGKVKTVIIRGHIVKRNYQVIV